MVQPGPLPPRSEGVNIALFAKQTDNAVGRVELHALGGARVTGLGNCGRFRDADAAQRAFLAGGGPERDRYGIDPDGDGFACHWDPAPYRALASSSGARVEPRRIAGGERGADLARGDAATKISSAAKARRRAVAGKAPGERADSVRRWKPPSAAKIAPSGSVGEAEQSTAGRGARRATPGPSPARGAGRRGCARPQAAAKARASARRHSKQGRWPAASAVASSRKKSSV